MMKQALDHSDSSHEICSWGKEAEISLGVSELGNIWRKEHWMVLAFRELFAFLMSLLPFMQLWWVIKFSLWGQNIDKPRLTLFGDAFSSHQQQVTVDHRKPRLMKPTSKTKGFLQHHRQLLISSPPHVRCWLASTQVEMSFVETYSGLQSLQGQEGVGNPLMQVSVEHHILNLSSESPLHSTMSLPMCLKLYENILQRSISSSDLAKAHLRTWNSFRSHRVRTYSLSTA